MSKLKNPLLSLRASGTLARVLTFVRRGKVDLVERTPIPKDAHTSTQLAWRTMFNLCVDLWHTLSIAEKAEWESAARSRHMTGYAWYISQCLRPNPGIYLPLAGGTMSGDIDMDSNKVTGLPAPTQNHHAARKSYVDALITAVRVLPKPLFFPVTAVSGGATITFLGTWAVARLDANAEYCYTDFFIPDDFGALVEAVLRVIPRATQAAANWDLTTRYAAPGEANNIHSENDVVTTYNVTDAQVFEVDLSGVLTAIAPGDSASVRMLQSNAGHNLDVLGVRLKYTPA